MDDKAAAAGNENWTQMPLWRFRAVRDAAFLLGTIAALWVAWVFRSLTVPVLFALAGAVLVEPIINRAAKVGIPRTLAALMLLVVLVGALSGLFAVGMPALSQDVRALAEALPGRLHTLGLPVSGAEGIGLFDQNLRSLISSGTTALNFISGTVTGLGFALFVIVFTVSTFVYLAAHLDWVRAQRVYVSESNQQLLGELLAVFEGYLRGQALVALWTTLAFSVGFSWAGVPFALVAALVGGILSFIPNGQISGWILALLFVTSERIVGGGPGGWAGAVLLPTLVYAVSQSLETFAITPVVQGNKLSMHPLVVMGALIAGAAVGGLLGVLLAIPVTACVGILFRQRIAPALRERAEAALPSEAMFTADE